MAKRGRKVPSGVILAKKAKETPPRRWGNLLLPAACIDTLRNTPTKVGKSWPSISTVADMEKHPHEGGEILKILKYNPLNAETPPRRWGNLPVFRF